MKTALICLAVAFLLPSAFGADNHGYYMQPTIHGDTLVFVSQGDLWQVGIGGGDAHALTSHVAPASNPSLSPDGRSVAFSGTYEGPRDVYVLPLSGDVPKRLTYGGGMSVVGWTPDGKILAATESHATLPNLELVSIDPNTRAQAVVPLAQASNGVYDPSGRTLFFTRFAFQGSQTKRYKGGTAQNIWSYAQGAPEAVPLTKNFPGTSKDPMWWGRRIYFLSDRDGWMNLWSMNEQGGDVRQITHSAGLDIQSAALDGGRIAYQLGADIHVFDLNKNADSTIDITLDSDFDQSLERWIKDPAQFVSSYDLSGNGSKLVLTARGTVFVAPAEPGRLVQVTRKPGVRYRFGMLTPDGKQVIALSDESGETEWWRFPANGVGTGERLSTGSSVTGGTGTMSPDGKNLAYQDKNQILWILDLTTKKVTKAATSLDGGFDSVTWSPDSQWLAFGMPTPTFSRLMLYSLKDASLTAITTDRSDATSPAWSPDGNWLYFLSDRTFHSQVSSPWGARAPEPYFTKQTKIYLLGLKKGLRSPFQPDDELYSPAADKGEKPVKIQPDMDGLASRLWAVPIEAGNYGLLTTDGKRLYFLGSDDGQSADLEELEIKNRDISAKKVATAVSGYMMSSDRSKLLISKAGRYYITSAGGVSLEKPVDLSNWAFTVEPQAEWRQMFLDAWRLERDYFYDAHLHGVDWDAVYKKYLPMVNRVRSREELSNLIAQVVGELSALHTFVVGGDLREPLENISVASLGAELSPDRGAGGYRVTRIYNGEPDYPESMSPLSRPEVAMHQGDVILAINGQDTLDAPDIETLLRNQSGKQTLLHIKNGSDSKLRDTIVVPIDRGSDFDLRYTDWEVSRRTEVEKAGSGQIGYVHLRAMGSNDIEQWERDFYPVFNRQGLILDVRHNNGGNIDSWILEKLLRKAWFYWQARVGTPYWNMQSAFRGYVVVLCDESTASDGEAFTEGFKRLKLGKVIGERTWGGEIWLSFSNSLIDGGIASAAEFGVYGPEGKWLIEGHGVDPDMEVDNLPHATFLGKDAQLEAAIDYLGREIKEHPVPVPPHPAYPDKSFPAKKSG